MKKQQVTSDSYPHKESTDFKKMTENTNKTGNEANKTIFDSLPIHKIEAYLAELSNEVEKGTDKRKLITKFKLAEDVFSELFSIAKANTKNRKFKKKMYMNQNDLRFATPEEVSYYRAARLKCKTIVDLGAGIGGQSIPFSEACEKVIAVEIDHRKIEYAKKNAEIHGRKNITFIEGDLLDDEVIKRIKFHKPDVIFFDSQRAAEETARTIESVQPDINEIIKKYSKVTKNIAIEVPAQLTPDKIPKTFDCEKEYISYKGQLNRLTLYFGEMKRDDSSVISLPDGFYLSASKKDILEKDYVDFGKSNKLQGYLIEVSEAVSQANLLDEFAKRFNLSYFAKQKKAVFFTSNILVQNPLVKNFYVLSCVNKEFMDIMDALKEHNAGKITLRANISPDNYWSERKKYEDKLKGEKNLHLFLFNKEAVIAEELK